MLAGRQAQPPRVDGNSISLCSALGSGSGEEAAGAQHLTVKGLLWFSPLTPGFAGKAVFKNPPALLPVWT